MCNGSTPDSDSVCGGSNPSSSAKNQQASLDACWFLLIHYSLFTIHFVKIKTGISDVAVWGAHCFIVHGFPKNRVRLNYHCDSLKGFFKMYFGRFTIHPNRFEAITFGMHKCVPNESVAVFYFTSRVRHSRQLSESLQRFSFTRLLSRFRRKSTEPFK